jgi:broad specificity phosphatase PhoE
METAISFVRHGEVYNPDNIFYGRLAGFRLSNKGNYQAVKAAETLNGRQLAAVFSSPLLRARQTAGELVKSNPHLRLHISNLLSEAATPFDGQPARKVDVRHGDVYTGSNDQFEQPIDIVQRVQNFIQRARRQYAGKQIAAVTHGDVIAFVILWVHRQPLIPRHKSRLTPFGIADGYPALASITTFTFLTTLNDEMPAVAYVRPY